MVLGIRAAWKSMSDWSGRNKLLSLIAVCGTVYIMTYPMTLGTPYVPTVRERVERSQSSKNWPSLSPRVIPFFQGLTLISKTKPSFPRVICYFQDLTLIFKVIRYLQDFTLISKQRFARQVNFVNIGLFIVVLCISNSVWINNKNVYPFTHWLNGLELIWSLVAHYCLPGDLLIIYTTKNVRWIIFVNSLITTVIVIVLYAKRICCLIIFCLI